MSRQGREAPLLASSKRLSWEKWIKTLARRPEALGDRIAPSAAVWVCAGPGQPSRAEPVANLLLQALDAKLPGSAQAAAKLCEALDCSGASQADAAHYGSWIIAARAGGGEALASEAARRWPEELESLALESLSCIQVWLALPEDRKAASLGAFRDFLVSAMERREWTLARQLCEALPERSSEALVKALLSDGFGRSLSQPLLGALKNTGEYGGKWGRSRVWDECGMFLECALGRIRPSLAEGFAALALRQCEKWAGWEGYGKLLSAAEALGSRRAMGIGIEDAPRQAQGGKPKAL